ncbi:MAG: hypothetical protein U0T79_13680 [Ferruginibacter sp.]
MRTIAGLIISFFLLASCNDKDKEATTHNWVALRADSINTVLLTDTLVIYESVCRGCAYEGSTRFDIQDSLGMIKLVDIISTDDNSSDMAGGSISKDLLLKPVRTGTTRIRLFKFLSPDSASADSARSITYMINVKN